MLQLSLYNLDAFNTVAYTSSLAHWTVTMFVVALHVYQGSFSRATAVPAGTAESAYWLWEFCLSVCLSVRQSVSTRYGFKARWDRDSGSSSYDTIEPLVSYEVIWCHWVKRFPSNEGIIQGYPLRNRYFTTIGSSRVKTVADRQTCCIS